METFEKELEEAKELAKTMKSTPRGYCLLCKEKMNVSPGQIVVFHKSCRTEGRKRYSREAIDAHK